MNCLSPNPQRVIFSFFIILLVLAACQKKNPGDPKAAFATQKDCKGITPCEVKFINHSQGAISSFHWDFGDGTTSTAESPIHSFDNGSWFVVKLRAKGEEKEDVFEDTVFIFETPPCESKGTFACAKKIISNSPLQDVITPTQTVNYYYFSPERPGVALIELKPVPDGGSVRIDILSEANGSSTALATETGKSGETIRLYCGPLETREHYIRVLQYSPTASNKPYVLTYIDINKDEHEINNTFAQATVLPLGITLQGSILAQKDVDYFEVNQVRAGVLDITVTPVPLFPGTNRLYLTVFNEANSNTAVGNTSGLPGETIQLAVGPLEAGKHYIKLESYSESPDLYKITTRFDSADLNEYNNNFNTATDLHLGVTMKGTIRAKNDIDFFKFTATQNGPLTIKMPNVPAGLSYLYIHLFSAANSNSEVFHTGAYGNNPVSYTSSKQLVAGSVYYLRLDPSGGESPAQYALTLSQ